MNSHFEPDSVRQLAGAEIIPFPSRVVRAARDDAFAPIPVAAASGAPVERLQLALANLIAAQAEQKAALERWQSALGNLQTGVRGLGQSLRGYVKALSEIAPSSTPR